MKNTNLETDQTKSSNQNITNHNMKMKDIDTGINKHVTKAKVIVKSAEEVELFTTGFVQDAKSVRYVKLITSTLIVTRNMFSTIGSGFKSLVGGRLEGQIKLMKFNRAKIIEEIQTQAMLLGANAVVSLRIDADNVQGFVNFFAYGTAVIVKYK